LNKFVVKEKQNDFIVAVAEAAMQTPLPRVNFTNLLAQSANGPAVSILRHLVSPTKTRPTLPVKTIRRYAQL